MRSARPSDAPPPRLGARFRAALPYAAELHGRQLRKGGRVPYVAHLLAVCALVLELGGDEDEAIAALLHDAVEDQGGAQRLEDIRGRFGDHVAQLVAECSESEELPWWRWRERKESTVAGLATVSAGALRISLADKLHNARTVLQALSEEGDAVWDHFTGSRQQTVWYYRAIASALRARVAGDPTLAGLEVMLDELDHVTDELERRAARSVWSRP